MKVGFLVNQLDNRGTGNATFDYAHYNEALLGNESFIFTFSHGNHEKIALDRYLRRFNKVYHADAGIPAGLDVLYHVKSGENDGFTAPTGTRYVVHAVFNATQKHGDRYAAISEWLGKRDGAPYVNHNVALPSISGDLREYIGIPSDATVFGRHGGFDTFDVPFAWSAISKALDLRNDLYFIFLNTRQGIDHPRVFYTDQVATPEQKKMFINSCDAMIHARGRGETFGVAVGEFSACGKSVLSYGLSPEKAHFDLDNQIVAYDNEQELVNALLLDTVWGKTGRTGYDYCTPEIVMKQFKEVFLD